MHACADLGHRTTDRIADWLSDWSMLCHCKAGVQKNKGVSGHVEGAKERVSRYESSLAQAEFRSRWAKEIR
jgi:hypothetical protein